MATVMKKMVDGWIVSFVFNNGDKVSCSGEYALPAGFAEKHPAAFRELETDEFFMNCITHAVKQKVGDKAAAEKTSRGKFDAVRAEAERFESREWGAARNGGTAVLDAVDEITGKLRREWANAGLKKAVIFDRLDRLDGTLPEKLEAAGKLTKTVKSAIVSALATIDDAGFDKFCETE